MGPHSCEVGHEQVAPRVVIAIDSFKGSLSSVQAGQAAAEGVARALPEATVAVVPVADGGEGTLAALMAATGGERWTAPAHDCLGRALEAETGSYTREGRRIQVVEAASTIGLDLVEVDPSLPPRAHSRGVGEHLRAVLDADEVLLTLGGTATTDGGTGLLGAFGARFFDAHGERIPLTENPLWRLADADLSDVRLDPAVALTVLCDVTNPLTGPQGSAHVFAAQKGADQGAVQHLDAQLVRWGQILTQWSGRAVADVPGAGAAGGIGAALLAMGARIESGFARVAAEARLADTLAGATLVLSGEGRVDAQTAFGKVPAGVAQMSRLIAPQARIVLLAGQVVDPLDGVNNLVDATFAIHRAPLSLAAAMEEAATRAGLCETAFQVARLAGAPTTCRCDV